MTEVHSDGGYYCSTSGTVFVDKEALAEHYKSDLHRYNLKRKVAGLPPVTKEWFDARRAQLTSMQNAQKTPKIFVCPLTNKKFQSEATYANHTQTKKFRDAMKMASLTAVPDAKIVFKVTSNGAEERTGPSATQLASTFKGMTVRATQRSPTVRAPTAAENSSVEDSDWETDEEFEGEVPVEGEWSDEEEAPNAVALTAPGNAMADAAGMGSDDVPPTLDASQWEQWDLCRSLFDNHTSPSFKANLEYMYKKFGFYLPDSEYLQDPEGLLRYLGAKLQYGLVPLYSRGDDPSARRFRSLHAVQRHMIDSNRCGVAYDNNEDEYEEFYEYPDDDIETALALADEDASEAGQELVVAMPGSSQIRIFGSRSFRHLYRQRHRPPEQRSGVLANQMRLSYRSLGVPQVSEEEVVRRRQRQKFERRRTWSELKSQLANDKIFKLPKNVTY